MCQCTSELWRPHPDWVGFYDVSTCGRVRSVDRAVPWARGATAWLTGRLLVQVPDGSGRPRVTLIRSNEPSGVVVCRLVLEAFVGWCPEGMEACHNNGRNTDNHLTNLRWDTHPENIRDSVRHGTHRNTRKSTCPRSHQLVAPNLKPAAAAHGRRQCLACSRAYNDATAARKRCEVFDFRAAADRHYQRIMSVGPEAVHLMS